MFIATGHCPTGYGRIKMATKFETVRNTKSGKTAWVVCRYNRTNDGVAIVQVETGLGMRYWRADHVEAA